MDWVPDSDEGIALLVGAVAFTGALLGALLGFLSNYVNTSRQIARQERDARRAAYGEFLSAALAMQRFHDDSTHAYELARSFAESLAGYRDELADATDDDTREQITLAIEHISPQEAQAWQAYEEVTARFAKHYDEFLLMCHRLKIVAPSLIFDVAMQMYDSLGQMVSELDVEVRSAATDHFHETLKVFADLARADTRAPDAASWRKTAKPYLRAFREADIKPGMSQEALRRRVAP